jgi:hypothetical protein
LKDGGIGSFAVWKAFLYRGGTTGVGIWSGSPTSFGVPAWSATSATQKKNGCAAPARRRRISSALAENSSVW